MLVVDIRDLAGMQSQIPTKRVRRTESSSPSQRHSWIGEVSQLLCNLDDNGDNLLIVPNIAPHDVGTPGL